MKNSGISEMSFMQLETIFGILLDLGNNLAINKHSSQMHLSRPFYQPSFREKKETDKPKPLISAIVY